MAAYVYYDIVTQRWQVRRDEGAAAVVLSEHESEAAARAALEGM